MRWTDTPIHFLDFEGSAASGILEFGVATLQSGEITGTHTRLCRATGPVAAEDTKVHGLSADGLASQDYFAAEWERFAGLRATGPLAAHFAPVENSLLRKVWPYPRESPDFARPGRTAGDAPTPAGSAALQLAFKVSPPEIVNRCADELARQGVDLLSPPTDQPFGHRTLFFRDPDGNLLEVYADIPTATG